MKPSDPQVTAAAMGGGTAMVSCQLPTSEVPALLFLFAMGVPSYSAPSYLLRPASHLPSLSSLVYFLLFPFYNLSPLSTSFNTFTYFLTQFFHRSCFPLHPSFPNFAPRLIYSLNSYTGKNDRADQITWKFILCPSFLFLFSVPFFSPHCELWGQRRDSPVGLLACTAHYSSTELQICPVP